MSADDDRVVLMARDEALSPDVPVVKELQERGIMLHVENAL